MIGVEVELAFLERPFQLVEELPAKDLRKNALRDEEVRLARLPLLAIEAEPAAGDDAVDMWMVEERLRPSVQDCEYPHLCLQAALRHLEQGFGRRGEEAIVGCLAAGKEQQVQLLRDRKDDVEVGDRQEVLGSRLDPLRLLEPVTLGTVAIETRVIDG